MGNFKSGELALLLGAAYPEDILAVVGCVPSGVVWQGPSFLQSVSRPRSSWLRGGDPVPFVRFCDTPLLGDSKHYRPLRR